MKKNSKYIQFNAMIFALFITFNLLQPNLAQAGWIDSAKGIAKRACFWCKKDGESFLDSRKVKVTNTSAVPSELTKNGRKFADDYCDDLTEKVRRGELEDYVIGRDEEFRQMIEILNRGGKNVNKNPLLYGDSGVGKTTLLEKLAYYMVHYQEKLPKSLRGKRLVKLDTKSFTAGTGNRGDAEKRITALENFLVENPDVILYIDEVHVLAPEDKNQFNYLENMLTTLLGDAKGIGANQELKIVASTMSKSIDRIMTMEGMGRRFSTVLIKEPNFLYTMAILEPELLKIQQRHGVRIPIHVLETAVEVAKRHLIELRAPDNVKQLLWSIASSHENSRLHKPRSITDLSKKLDHNLLMYKSLASKHEPFFRLQQLKLKSEIEELKEKLNKLNSQWNEIEGDFLKAQDVISDVQEYSAYLEKILNDVGHNKSFSPEKLKQTAENLQKLAEAYPSQQMSEVKRISQELYQLPANNPSVYGYVRDLIEILEKDINLRREVLVGKTPFSLYDAVTDEDVYEFIATKTNKPIEMVRLGDPEKEIEGGLAGLVNRKLREKIVGQEPALQALVNQIKAFQRGLLPESEPIGHFLFLGPSRSGKTYIPQSLGELFGDGGYLRINMGDYKNDIDIKRLTGAPPSYAGYDDTVDIIEKVRKNPQLVICVDEVDLAHNDVIDFFMKLREEGIYKDNKGRQVDFRGVTFVYTSNVTENIDPKILKRITDPKKRRTMLEILIRKEKPSKFKEAFLNGMTDIIRFDHFTEKGKILVTDRIWTKLRNSINRSAKIDVILKPEVVEYLAKNSEGGNAAKIQQIIRAEVISRLKEISYKRGDLIDIELAQNAGPHDPPFNIVIRKDLREVQGDELTQKLIEREEGLNLDEILERTPDEQLPQPMSLDEMDQAIQQQRDEARSEPNQNDLMSMLNGMNSETPNGGTNGHFRNENQLELFGDPEPDQGIRETQTRPVRRRTAE